MDVCKRGWQGFCTRCHNTFILCRKYFSCFLLKPRFRILLPRYKLPCKIFSLLKTDKGTIASILNCMFRSIIKQHSFFIYTDQPLCQDNDMFEICLKQNVLGHILTGFTHVRITDAILLGLLYNLLNHNLL